MICITPSGDKLYPNATTYIPPRSICNTTEPVAYPSPIPSPEQLPYMALVTLVAIFVFLAMFLSVMYRQCRASAVST